MIEYPCTQLKRWHNSYFDNILKIKNVKVKFKSILKSINLKKKEANNGKVKFDILINTIAPDTLFNYKFEGQIYR